MTLSTNERAFLSAIAWSEIGPKLLAVSDDGYDVLVGSTPAVPKLFDGYADHPRKKVWIAALHSYSTAAGRYQILERYFDAYKKQLALPDFGHDSQDAIALRMVAECHALGDIENGYIASALTKCRNRWASLPGAGYGQHEQPLTQILAAYGAAGGAVA